MKKTGIEKLEKILVKAIMQEFEDLGDARFFEKYPIMVEVLEAVTRDGFVEEDYPSEIKTMSKKEIIDWFTQKSKGRLS